MSSAEFQSLACGTGIALIAYSRTFPRWVREKAVDRLLAAQETIKIMRAKLDEYKKVHHLLGDLEKEAAADGAFSTKKEELEFKLRLIGEITRRNDELLVANVRMDIASEAIGHCEREMRFRAIESFISLVLGLGLLVVAVIVRK